MIAYDQVEVFLSIGSTIDKEILRNVKVLFTTLAGTVPFDRDFGINPDVIDAPINEAEGMYMMECITKVRKYEARVYVSEIDFTSDLNGRLYPRVVLSNEPE